MPLAGILGDQQAALVGQTCFAPGEAKNTYGTGCFMLMNTGDATRAVDGGLVTTVAYQLGGQPACYALEGSIAIAGALVQWLRDNLGLIKSSAEIEALARSVPDNGDVYFVPAFSGLFAPYWRSARAASSPASRATPTAATSRAPRSRPSPIRRCDVLEAMERDSRHSDQQLRVDGGMVANDLLMQFQADMLGVPVVRPRRWRRRRSAPPMPRASRSATGEPEDLLRNWGGETRGSRRCARITARG